MDETYLITGITGYVGNIVAKKLIEQKKKVIGFARSEEKAKQVFGNLFFDMEIYYGDTRDKNTLEKAFIDRKDSLIVIHTAAIVSIQSKKIDKDMYEVNVQGTQNVIDLCLKYQVKRMVYVSSVHAIPLKKKKQEMKEVSSFDPNLVYGGYAKTKAISSQLVLDAVKKQGLDAIIVHPSGILGPGDYSNTHLTQVINDFLKNKLPASVNGGYNFVDVRDVADGILQGVELGKKGECYLLTGKYHSVTEILDIVADLKQKKRIRTLPMGIAYFGLPFLWILFKIRRKRPLYTKYSLDTLKSNGNFSCTKAEKELHYHSREFFETIKDQVAFMENRK